MWKKNHCVTFKEDICTATYILFSWRNLQLTLEVSISLALRNSFVSKDQSSITMQKHNLNELRFFVGPKFVFLLNLYICCLWRHCRKSPSQNNWFTSGEIWSDNNNKPLPSLVIFFNFFFWFNCLLHYIRQTQVSLTVNYSSYLVLVEELLQILKQ